MVVVYGQSYDFLTWFILSFIFFVLAIRCFCRPSLGDKYQFDLKVCICLIFMIFFSSIPIKKFMFENKIQNTVNHVIGTSTIFFCQGLVDSMFNYQAAGFIETDKNKIYLTYSTCKFLKHFIENPNDANMSEIFAVHVLTHEAIHATGVLNEAKTDCIAFQRNHEMFRALGSSKTKSEEFAIKAYLKIPNPRRVGYYSKECKPGGKLDQNYPNAVWQKALE